MLSGITDQDMIYRFDRIEKNGVNYYRPSFKFKQIVIKTIKNLAKTQYKIRPSMTTS
jgi:hypothetical protein